MNKFTFRQVILLLAFVLVLPSYSQDKRHYVSLNQNETEWTITHGDDVLFHGTGHVDFNNMPPFIKYVVDSLDAVKPVNRVKKNAGMNHAPATTIVEPLITTSWDQGTPYNDLMPTIDGVHAKAGCSTISTAQVVNYYRYMKPWTVSYDQTTYTDPEVMVHKNITKWYDPSEVSCPMPVYHVDYSFNGWSNNLSPAELCEAIAFAQQASFSSDETGTYYIDQSHAIQKRFGYLTEVIQTDVLNVVEPLKAQLNQQRPVIINAADNNNTGHSFIVDGYSSEEEFHLNLGWGESWNCWSTPELWAYNQGIYAITLYPDYNDEGLFLKEDEAGTAVFHNLTTGEVFKQEMELAPTTNGLTGLFFYAVNIAQMRLSAGEYEYCLEYESGKQISVPMPVPSEYELYTFYDHYSPSLVKGTSRLSVPYDCRLTFYACFDERFAGAVPWELEVILEQFHRESYSVGEVELNLTNRDSTLNVLAPTEYFEQEAYGEYKATIENIPAGYYQFSANVHSETLGEFSVGIGAGAIPCGGNNYRDLVDNYYNGELYLWYGSIYEWTDASNPFVEPLMFKLPRHNTKGSYTLDLAMGTGAQNILEIYAKWVDELDENGNVIYVPFESTITYIVDGQVYKTDNVVIDSEIELPDAPEIDGYTFYRWEGLPEDMIMPDHDITVTAVYALRGDVNLDEKVNITDAVDIVNYCLGYGSINFEAVLSDVNRDEMYTITDAISVLNIIYGEPVSYAPRRVNASCESLDLSQMNNNTIALCMNSANDYSAFQFDVELPEGVELDAVALNNYRCKDFAVRFNKVEDNIYKVVAYNLANEPLANGSDNLLTLNLSGANESDEVRVTNIHFSTQKAVDVLFDDLSLSMTTGIQSHTVATDDVEYNVAGLRVNKDYRGIVIVNGKKVIRK